MSNLDKEGAGHDLVSLAEAYCNDTLGPDGLQKLEQLLLSDPEARQTFRRYLGLDAALRDYGDSAAAGWLAGLPKPAASLTERVDVDAVLRDSLGESRDSVTEQMGSLRQDKPRVREKGRDKMKRRPNRSECSIISGVNEVNRYATNPHLL